MVVFFVLYRGDTGTMGHERYGAIEYTKRVCCTLFRMIGVVRAIDIPRLEMDWLGCMSIYIVDLVEIGERNENALLGSSSIHFNITQINQQNHTFPKHMPPVWRC